MARMTKAEREAKQAAELEAQQANQAYGNEADSLNYNQGEEVTQVAGETAALEYTKEDQYYTEQPDAASVLDTLPYPEPATETSIPEQATANDPKRDLGPEALGFDISNVGDVEEGDLPDFATRDSKYGQYFLALDDSKNRGKWKHVSGITDPEALAAALRNAAVRREYGLEVRTLKDDNQQFTGDVYFLAREKRARTVTADAESVTSDATS